MRPHKSRKRRGGAEPSTVEVRGRAQRAEGLGPPKLVKSLEPVRTPVTSYQLPDDFEIHLIRKAFPSELGTR